MTTRNENGDGFLNDPGEDVTFAYNAVDETITSTDNVTGDVSVLARNVLPNPDGTPLFTYVTDPVSGVPKSIRLAVTVSGRAQRPAHRPDRHLYRSDGDFPAPGEHPLDQ